MADACVFLMENRDFSDVISPEDRNTRETVIPAKAGKGIRNTHINIGTGKEISIEELASTIKKVIGFNGELYFNADKPDGTMRKLTDSSKLEGLGWKYQVELKDGIERMYDWYCLE